MTQQPIHRTLLVTKLVICLWNPITHMRKKKNQLKENGYHLTITFG